MKKMKHPAEIELEAFQIATPRDFQSKAFVKMMDALEAWAKYSIAQDKAFVAEFIAHHTNPDGTVGPACAAALKEMPKTRK